MGVTPPEACMVPTRLVVLAVPVFKAQKLTVTISPGSITALFGTQASAVRVAVPAEMAAAAAQPPVRVKFAIRVNWLPYWLVIQNDPLFGEPTAV